MSTKRGDPRATRAYKARRLEVLARDQWSCFYCQMPATTVDHVIPIKAGGDPIAYDNLVACCTKCNSSKGSRSEGVFLAHRYGVTEYDEPHYCNALHHLKTKGWQ